MSRTARRLRGIARRRRKRAAFLARSCSALAVLGGESGSVLAWVGAFFLSRAEAAVSHWAPDDTVLS